jgi:hypothetical protein
MSVMTDWILIFLLPFMELPALPLSGNSDEPKKRVLPLEGKSPPYFYYPRHISSVRVKSMARILVAYATKKGATAEIAHATGKNYLPQVMMLMCMK